jgi:glucose/arabinose dehydrogenase
MTTRLAAAAALLLACLAPAGARAHAGHCVEPPAAQLGGDGVQLTPVARFGAVTSIASRPGDQRRLYVVERRGVIRELVDGVVQDAPLIDLSAEIGPTLDPQENERGMMSVAFARSGRFYVFHSDGRGDARVAEFRPGGPARGRTLLRLRHDFATQHYGGQVAVGPDGLVYVSFGEATRSLLAQKPGLYGKIVRLDPRRPRRSVTVLAMGLRNPYRFAFAPGGRKLIVVDVGDADYDEIDVLDLRRRAIANFGWPYLEGPKRKIEHRFRGYVPPVLAVRHPLATALIGGVVVRDPRLPALRGRYVFGDFCDGWLATTRVGVRRPRLRMAGPVVPLLTAFGEDGRRRVYAASHDGTVYRVGPAG